MLTDFLIHELWNGFLHFNKILYGLIGNRDGYGRQCNSEWTWYEKLHLQFVHFRPLKIQILLVRACYYTIKSDPLSLFAYFTFWIYCQTLQDFQKFSVIRENFILELLLMLHRKKNDVGIFGTYTIQPRLVAPSVVY